MSVELLRPNLRFSMPNRRYFVLASLILLAALGIRVGVAVWWQNRLDSQGMQFSMGDSDSYWYLASQISERQPYQYQSPDAAVFRTPGYPWLLSWFTDSTVLNARLSGCAAGTFAVLLCIGISAYIFDRPTSLIAGGMAAIYPGGITTSVLVLSEAPFMPLMMAILGCLWMTKSSPSQTVRAVGWTVAAGLLSGLAILVRPSWLLFMPFYYGVQIVFLGERGRTFRHALIAGISIAVVMLPWWVRNYRVTGEFVLTTLQVGASLYDGLGPQATGGSDSGMEFSAEFANRLRADDVASSLGPGEVRENFEYRLNKQLTQAAWASVTDEPVRFFKLAVLKIYRTWWPLPSASELPGGTAARRVFAFGMLGIVVPACVHLLRGNWSHMFPYLIPAIYFTLLHAVFVGSIRYRQPAVFAIIVLAAPELKDWGQRLFHKFTVS